MAPVVLLMRTNTIMIGAAGFIIHQWAEMRDSEEQKRALRQKGRKPGCCKQTDQVAAETSVRSGSGKARFP